MEIVVGLPRDPGSKTVDRREAAVRVARWREVGRRVVFTNGCFDLMHQGHARYLAAARKLGDALVVGLNSDASVRRIKGEKRPILPQDERAELLASLECVDLVVVFEEDDPGALIQALKPGRLVKGADWPKEKIIGRETVEASGGDVVNIPLVEGRSTSSVIEEILKRFK
jgi:D-beta-D-heptose 7-phosphate kinase/D-beta-D-heptose 1-phosphate adenosyltransferase